MRRSRIHGVAILPMSLHVASDVLGEKVETRIDSRDVSLTIPVEGDSDWLKNPITTRTPAAQLHPDQWGHKFTTDTWVVRAVAISFLAEPGFGHQGLDLLAKNYLKWFGVVQEWADAWMGAPMKPAVSGEDSLIHIATTEGERLRSPGRGRLIVLNFSPLSKAQVRGAFKRAARSDRPPVEHALLTSARAAHLEGDGRRAAIDAGSAAEVALAAKISATLGARRVADEFISLTIKNANGIAGLIRLYESLGFEPPVSANKAMNQLAEVRNKAAHAGLIPEPNVAQRAVNIAAEIVAGVSPLPAS